MAGGVPPWWCWCDPRWLVVCLPGVWWCDPRWLVVPPGILARIFTAGHPGGYARHSSVRRNSRIKKSSVAGMFLRCYYSICQLFKFSYRLLHAKVFRGENIIKTLFSINYRGYFIIQATHSTINYSYFLHKTDRKHTENQ